MLCSAPEIYLEIDAKKRYEFREWNIEIGGLKTKIASFLRNYVSVW